MESKMVKGRDNTDNSKNNIVISVVMPCLNEEQSIAYCIDKAFEGIKSTGLRGEVVVSDNGSKDNSVKIAKSKGARVVHQPLRGYGNAYMKGITEAYGKYIVIGDSDKTYDFTDLKKFITPLTKGYDMVMGSRLKGKIMPGAMPWLHKYIGNPLLSWFLNVLFKTGISDSHCGMRSFTKDAFNRMHLKTTGMEFASEMVINSSKAGLKIKEVAITLYANTDRKPHLRSFRDGWRHLRFMMLYSPFHLFFLPGIISFLLGIMIFLGLMITRADIYGLNLGPLSASLGSLLTIIGFQIITLGYFSKVAYSKISSFDKELKGVIKIVDKLFVMGTSIIIASILFAAGFIINLAVLIRWIVLHYGGLSLINGVISIFGITLIFLSVQLIFSSLFVNILKSE